MNQRRHFLRSLSGAAVASLVTGAGTALPAWAQSTTGATSKGAGTGSTAGSSAGSAGGATGSPAGSTGAGSSGSSTGGGSSTGAAGTAGAGGAAGTTPKLQESDTQAVALGYKDDTTRVDQKKFPMHQVTQVCSGCQFYQGSASNATAPCTIFAGKQVAAKGWCSSYVKKAAG